MGIESVTQADALFDVQPRRHYGQLLDGSVVRSVSAVSLGNRRILLQQLLDTVQGNP